MFKKTVVMKCPDCKTVVDGSTWFLKKKFECKNCGRTIDSRTDSLEVVTCNNCGNHVMFDTKRGAEHNCPNCGASLEENSVETFEATCPNCHISQKIRYNEKMHTCILCETVFDAEKARKVKENETSAEASVITISEEEDAIIFKHKQTVFPYASQVVVPEGYTALILHNGRCLAPSEPGNYILSDTLMNQQDILKSAVLNENQQISVQIFFVKKRIDRKIKWGQNFDIRDNAGEIIGTINYAGCVSTVITDAKAFADFVGFKTIRMTDLFPVNGGSYTGFIDEIVHQCNKSALAILTNAAQNAGGEPNYKTLSNNQIYYEDEICKLANSKLVENGIKAVNLEITQIAFEENYNVFAKRHEEEKLNNNKENVRVSIEKLFDWASTEIDIHMQNNISLKSSVTYGGAIKLRIIDDDKFFSRTEVKAWSKQGVDDKTVSNYIHGLVRSETTNVFNDTMQAMINDTGADIRDLSIYYRYLRNNIVGQLAAIFDGYGLAIETFSMKETSRRNSATLEATSKTLDKKVSSENYKTEEEIKQDVYSFDQKLRMEREVLDTNEDIFNDNEKLRKENAYVQNDGERAKNDVTRYTTKAKVTQEKDRADYETTMNKRGYDHQLYASDEQWKHDQTMRNYGYQSDYSEANHQSDMQNIAHKTDVKAALHYMDQQEIENRAKQLRTKWEHESRMEADELRHRISLAEQEWEANRKLTLGKTGLQNDIEINATEKDRVVNSILRKIAESDLELTEKKDMYQRMFNNLKIEDTFTHWKEETEAKLDFKYKEGHLGYILTREEQDYLDVVLDRGVARNEGIKNADFTRSMQQQQVNTAHAMEILKLQYDRDERQDNLQHELDLKDKEIEILKLQLDAIEKSGDQDVTKFGIQGAVDMERAHMNADVAKADIARQEAENKYRTLHEMYDRQMQDKREQDRLNREDEYSKRADELVSQMLAIQSAMQKMSLYNDRVAIQENADVKKVQAKSAAQAQNDQIMNLLEEIKKIAEKRVNRTENRNRNRGQQPNMGGYQTPYTGGNYGMNGQAPNMGGYQAPYTGGNYGMNGQAPNMGGYQTPYTGGNYGMNGQVPNMGGYQAPNMGGTYTNPVGNQPGFGGKKCPHCGAVSASPYSTYCTNCHKPM